jgi:hypothetical protein
MRKWVNPGGPGTISCGTLPSEIEEQLRRRTTNVLKRHGQTCDVIDKVVPRIFDAVSYAFAGRNLRFEKQGPGRPADVAGNILSSEVASVLGNAGLRGNWLAPGDAEEDGAPGLVAELEAIAQSAYKKASGSTAGTASRPARISEAKKLLGKITQEGTSAS